MSDEGDPRRDALHAFLQEQGMADHDKPAVLTGWAIVTEWMDEDGERWLSKGHASSKAIWEAEGLHHQALYGDWPDLDDEEGR